MTTPPKHHWFPLFWFSFLVQFSIFIWWLHIWFIMWQKLIVTALVLLVFSLHFCVSFDLLSSSKGREGRQLLVRLNNEQFETISSCNEKKTIHQSNQHIMQSSISFKIIGYKLKTIFKIFSKSIVSVSKVIRKPSESYAKMVFFKLNSSKNNLFMLIFLAKALTALAMSDVFVWNMCSKSELQQDCVCLMKTRLWNCFLAWDLLKH